MKALITLAAGLILVSTTFAQSSRRSEVKDNNQTNDRKSESTVKTERRVPSERRTEINDPRRNAATQPIEKKAEVTDQRKPESTMNSERRSSSPVYDNRSDNTNKRSTENRNPERMAVEKPQTPVTPVTPSRPEGQDRSSATNRRNPSEQNRNSYNNNNNNNNNNSNNSNNNNRPSYSTNTYNNNRREPQNREQVVIEHSRRNVERHHTVVHKSYRPVPVEVRRVKYPYRSPVVPEIIWTVELSRRYEIYYPAYRPYHYHIGMRIATISAYDAYDFVGEIARVYGRVVETYYSRETDEYFLYLGDYYPYQDFSVIIPGREARDFSRRPERFFNREYIEVTGLITRFEGKPEMMIKRSSQINVY